MGRSGAKGVRSHPKDDGDVRVGDVDTLDQRPNDITAQAPIRVGETGADVGRELLHLTQYQPELVEHARFVDLTRQRCLELCDPLPQTDDTRLKLLFGEKALGIAVDEASEALAQFAEVDGVGAVGAGGAAACSACQRRVYSCSTRRGSWSSVQTSAHTAVSTAGAAMGDATHSRTPAKRCASLPRHRY
jgi:hypothetical protein